MSMEKHGGMILTGKYRNTRRKTYPSETVSTTHHTWTDQGANPDLLGESPTTNHLNHGTALGWKLFMTILLLYTHDGGSKVKSKAVLLPPCRRQGEE
jgi:hypothetical protein